MAMRQGRVNDEVQKPKAIRRLAASATSAVAAVGFSASPISQKRKG
jgi:hypothetical protein